MIQHKLVYEIYMMYRRRFNYNNSGFLDEITDLNES